MSLIPHTEIIEGGALAGGQLPHPYLIETKYEVGRSVPERQGEKYVAYNKIPFKSYEYHDIDPNKKLPMNKDKITIENVILSFLELKNANASFTPVSSYPMRYIGAHITDFFNERLRNDTENYAGISLNNAWKDLEMRKKIYESVYSLRRQNLYLRGDYNHKTAEKEVFKKLTDLDIKGAIQNSIFSNNQFKAFTAKVIYTHFNAKKVLDFSSGWGGRMVAAASMDIDYIGIDPNKDIYKTYGQILDTLKPYYNSTITTINAYAEDVDYSKLDYDFVLTSPPYIEPSGKQVEKYRFMKDYSKNTFYTEFLLPTLYRIMFYLPVGKYLCINTHYSNIEIIQNQLLGKPTQSIPYKTKERAGGQVRRETYETERYIEQIYCFKKNANTNNFMERRLRSVGLKISSKPPSINVPINVYKGTGEEDNNITREIRRRQREVREMRKSNLIKNKKENLFKPTLQ